MLFRSVEDARDCASCALGGFNNGHAVSASAYENERFHGLHLVVEVASFFFVCEVRQIFFEDAHNIGFCESAVGKECFEPTDEGIDGFGVFVVCAYHRGKHAVDELKTKVDEYYPRVQAVDTVMAKALSDAYREQTDTVAAPYIEERQMIKRTRKITSP